MYVLCGISLWQCIIVNEVYIVSWFIINKQTLACSLVCHMAGNINMELIWHMLSGIDISQTVQLLFVIL